MDEKHWKIGELARATGLTVRTLHHYDEIGLLVPSERTQAGYRLYGEQDVRRLYEIRALRDLGIPLGDEGIARGLKAMIEEEGPERATRGAVDPELMDYVGRAIRLQL